MYSADPAYTFVVNYINQHNIEPAIEEIERTTRLLVNHPLIKCVNQTHGNLSLSNAGIFFLRDAIQIFEGKTDGIDEFSTAILTKLDILSVIFALEYIQLYSRYPESQDIHEWIQWLSEEHHVLRKHDGSYALTDMGKSWYESWKKMYYFCKDQANRRCH